MRLWATYHTYEGWVEILYRYTTMIGQQPVMAHLNQLILPANYERLALEETQIT
jgi:hypothetical protein